VNVGDGVADPVGLITCGADGGGKAVNETVTGVDQSLAPFTVQAWTRHAALPFDSDVNSTAHEAVAPTHPRDAGDNHQYVSGPPFMLIASR